jgi:hypothetical protein
MKAANKAMANVDDIMAGIEFGAGALKSLADGCKTVLDVPVFFILSSIATACTGVDHPTAVSMAAFDHTRRDPRV